MCRAWWHYLMSSAHHLWNLVGCGMTAGYYAMQAIRLSGRPSRLPGVMMMYKPPTSTQKSWLQWRPSHLPGIVSMSKLPITILRPVNNVQAACPLLNGVEATYPQLLPPFCWRYYMQYLLWLDDTTEWFLTQEYKAVVSSWVSMYTGPTILRNYSKSLILSISSHQRTSISSPRPK